MNWNTIKQLIADGYISCRKHPKLPLWIYNYTPKAAVDNYWPEEVRACRGLVADENHNIIARPFKKFFNFHDHMDIVRANKKPRRFLDLPNEPFTVQEKLDGSLIIGFIYQNELILTTRGSFKSPQAIESQKIFQELYSGIELNPNWTYLFEIIYPENRIVVNYGKRRSLVLLAAIDTSSGVEQDIYDNQFSKFHRVKEINAEAFNKHTLSELAAFSSADDPKNYEGIVVKFQSGLRVKVKLDEYVALHRILTQTTSKTIWHYLKEGMDLDLLKEGMPEEFRSWVDIEASQLRSEFDFLEEECCSRYRFLGDEKETALYIKSQPKKYQGILFARMRLHDYSKIIWKMIKPKPNKPFDIKKTIEDYENANANS